MSTTTADTKIAPAALFPRYEQTFPELTSQEIARMRRFGEIAKYRDGEKLFETGKIGAGMFVILSGHVTVTQRDGFGHVTPVIDHGPGQFLAEVGQLSGRVSLVDGAAEGHVETLLIPPDRLRALLVAEADLGERIMRALILRRVHLIQGGAGGPVLIGAPNSGGVHIASGAGNSSSRPPSGATRARMVFTSDAPRTGSADNAARRMARASSSIERPCSAAWTRRRALRSSSILRIVIVAIFTSFATSLVIDCILVID